MSDVQQEQPAAGDRWGDPIGDERKEELGKLFKQQQTWAGKLETERVGQASHFHHVPLTGADVAWLAEPSGGETVRGMPMPNLHLEGATLRDAHLEGATLHDAHLEGADLFGARLEGADLGQARLEGANLIGARLEGADLRGASFDKTSRLNLAQLDGARLDQVILDNTNLAVVEWDAVRRLGDERVAEQATYPGMRKWGGKRAEEYGAAARAYRLLATALQANGLGDVAARYSYRAKIMERRQRWYQRRLPAYLGSGFLALLAGYGYRLWRILVAYVLVVALFAVLYSIPGLARHGLSVDLLSRHSLDAFLANVQISLNSIHGRVSVTQFKADTALSWIATIESVVGIVIEGLFVAVLIQRLFSR